MELPDYKRAFDQPDSRGYFKWTQKLSRAVGGSVYHACHKDELTSILDSEELDLRSEWSEILSNVVDEQFPRRWFEGMI